MKSSDTVSTSLFFSSKTKYPQDFVRGLPGLLMSTLLFSVFLVACSGSSAQGGDILLFGAPLSLTGGTSTEGSLTLEGYELWVKTVNNNGGLKVGNTAYQVRLKTYDDQSNPVKSAQLTQRLITVDKVNFLLGPYGTSATLQDEAIAERYKIPMVEGNGAASSIFSRGFKYIFGVLSPATAYARVMLQAALALPTPPRNVAIISADDTFSKEVAAAARQYAQSQNLSVVYFKQYPSNSTDLTGVLTPLKTSGPDGSVPDMILGSGHEDEAVATIKEARQLDINAKLYAFTVGPGTPDFVAALKNDANYVLGSSQWTPQETYSGLDIFRTPENYAQIYQQAYGHAPAYQSASGTAAALAFQYALTQAGSIDPQRVRDALSTLNVQTFYGQLRFDSTGVNSLKPMATIQIQDGQPMTVYPSNVANSPLQYPTPSFATR